MMQTFIWACMIGSMVLILAAAPSVERRHPGPSWFDLQPYMSESKKARGRVQQKQWHPERNRKKRY